MDRQFTPGSATEPTSTVEVSISCRNLLDLDMFSRSDPMCVVYHQQIGTTEWIELLRTEIIWDNLNPDFSTKLTIDYRFEEEQPLRFEIYDIDSPSESLTKHDFLGFSECTIGSIVSAGFNGLTLPLSQNRSKYYPIQPKKKRSKGHIVLHAEELTQLKEELAVTLEGEAMGSRLCECFFPLNVFYIISKVTEAGLYIVVYRSETSPGPNPSWAQVKLPMRNLCNGDKERGLQIQFFQEGINGYHTSLGFLYTTVLKLISSVDLEPLPLVGSNGKEKSCRVGIKECKISPIYTFVEYIRCGTQIHCCFAIDFTASNGDPNDPNSLHHFTTIPNQTNPYEQAIQAVGEIIQDYDNEKKFPVYGFGARVPPNGTISHKFFVTLSDSPYCNGISGVLDGYKNCIRQVQLSGPTNFAPIIREVAKMARENQDGGNYYVLLIMTDGIINDMPDTKEAIVDASVLPLSIIIVGVGGANFDAMDELDGDTVRLSYNGKLAERDIVQFVPYRDSFSWMATVCPEVAGKWSSSYESTGRMAKVKLAQEVLSEIPDQFTSFMKSNNLAPLNTTRTSS